MVLQFGACRANIRLDAWSKGCSDQRRDSATCLMCVALVKTIPEVLVIFIVGFLLLLLILIYLMCMGVLLYVCLCTYVCLVSVEA